MAEPTLKVRADDDPKECANGSDHPKQRPADGLGSVNVLAERMNFTDDVVEFPVPLFRLILERFHGLYELSDGLLHVHDSLKGEIMRGRWIRWRRVVFRRRGGGFRRACLASSFSHLHSPHSLFSLPPIPKVRRERCRNTL